MLRTLTCTTPGNSHAETYFVDPDQFFLALICKALSNQKFFEVTFGEKTVNNTFMLDTYHSVFVQTHRRYNTEREP